MDVDAVADELYGLAPNAFTPRRDALVKQARSAGDREAAAEMAALREATTTLAGPELRALFSQRQQLVHTLVEQARFLGQEEGQRVTEDAARGLEDTFSAALADPAAAQALSAGRLVAGLSHQGYGDPQAGGCRGRSLGGIPSGRRRAGDPRWRRPRGTGGPSACRRAAAPPGRAVRAVRSASGRASPTRAQ
ncbi:MAG: hypothetical protein LH461_03960 [Spirochaetaceae bacterium]|nr:hypothetical protein [Spirochaetaceae bacterium]